MTLVVQVPEKLSKEAKELLRLFDEKTGSSLTAAERATSDGDNGPDGSGGKKKKRFWE